MRKLLLILVSTILTTIIISAQESTYIELDQGVYRLTVPENYTGEVAVPLVVALHSTASSPHAMAIMTGFDEYAEATGMIVAYPKSDSDIWNEGNPQLDIPRDDVAFINDVVASVTDAYNIDNEQIMLTGYGSGGLMAYHIACESPETFNTIAVAGAMMWGYHVDNCAETSAPVNMMIFRGSEDIVYLEDTYEFRGLFDATGQPIFGVDDTLDHWGTRFNCTNLPTESNHIRVYQGCDDDVRVAYVELTGARQNWLRDRDDWVLNQFDVDVSEIMLQFLQGDDSWIESEPIAATTQARTYSLYVPQSYDDTTETPVFILLHGRFGNGAGTASHTQINVLAEEEGFIGIYPDGLTNAASGVTRDTGWNYIRDVPYYPNAHIHDDTEFIQTIIDDLSQDLNIDRNRIYVAGLSNGGFMVQRLACDAPEYFAGFASVAGAGFGGMHTVCDGDESVNMLVMHGTLDNNIQWSGNPQQAPDGSTFYSALPIPVVTEYWAQRMQCTDSTRDDVDIPDTQSETGLMILTANNCKDDADLVIYAIINGGHNWPGIDGGIPNQVAGLINLEVNATQIIWDFFISQSLD